MIKSFMEMVKLDNDDYNYRLEAKEVLCTANVQKLPVVVTNDTSFIISCKVEPKEKL